MAKNSKLANTELRSLAEAGVPIPLALDAAKTQKLTAKINNKLTKRSKELRNFLKEYNKGMQKIHARAKHGFDSGALITIEMMRSTLNESLLRLNKLQAEDTQIKE